MSGPSIRPARPEDLGAIRDIYAHYVENSLASFEETAPSVDEMARRLAAVTAMGAPYLAAELGGRVVGFAYAGRFRERSAYRHTVEDSIYLAPDAVGNGVGSILLGDLIERTTRIGYRRMVAVIGDSGNAASIRLHARAGFVRAGLLPSHGFKFGRWVDVILMQRPLGQGDATLPA